MLIERESILTGKVHLREVDVTQEQLNAWRGSGRLIQAAMPHLTEDDREFVLTGITPEEWTAFLGEDE